jgi:hypothetical protein
MNTTEDFPSNRVCVDSIYRGRFQYSAIHTSIFRESEVTWDKHVGRKGSH